MIPVNGILGEFFQSIIFLIVQYLLASVTKLLTVYMMYARDLGHMWDPLDFFLFIVEVTRTHNLKVALVKGIRL